MQQAQMTPLDQHLKMVSNQEYYSAAAFWEDKVPELPKEIADHSPNFSDGMAGVDAILDYTDWKVFRHRRRQPKVEKPKEQHVDKEKSDAKIKSALQRIRRNFSNEEQARLCEVLKLILKFGNKRKESIRCLLLWLEDEKKNGQKRPTTAHGRKSSPSTATSIAAKPTTKIKLEVKNDND